MSEERFLKCIADNNRRQILWCLGGSERCVNDIMEQTNLEQTLVSFHLKALKRCGLVKSRRDGKKIMYKVTHKGVISALKFVKEVASDVRELSSCAECEPPQLKNSIKKESMSLRDA
ncbi:MAG: metalloregulator ArsR/SmtB family transcription factor [Methanocellales archaeon]|nr:metalloregulator ArsR/SmtB family transcription factor [Methanocellales archaeon]MDD3291808.1 metalloregulator ArsR/SmtB family transcription factor [Methanocellales archaeon]MDD5234578.1 metalloregulator ArsR/SmtB family transcription factor [Methanocellales archaeon]MDD5485069.1 metalloregulator ArsR/SmtB family transcription factor [Methanocellales archaeon]